jgi:hypothetical protein
MPQKKLPMNSCSVRDVVLLLLLLLLEMLSLPRVRLVAALVLVYARLLLLLLLLLLLSSPVHGRLTPWRSPPAAVASAAAMQKDPTSLQTTRGNPDVHVRYQHPNTECQR